MKREMWGGCLNISVHPAREVNASRGCCLSEKLIYFLLTNGVCHADATARISEDGPWWVGRMPVGSPAKVLSAYYQ